MGAGSSKSSGQNTTRASVANVNNDSDDDDKVSGFPQKNVKDEQKNDDNEQNYNLNNKDYHKDFGKSSPLKPIEPNKKEQERIKKEKEKELKRIEKERQKHENIRNGNKPSKLSLDLQYEEDSDFNDDIDEVLKIPFATDFSKDKKRDKKTKKDEFSQNIENEDFSRQNDFSRNDNVPLPETYAQRLQRKQYKLQQDLLIREKTIMRASQEWDLGHHEMEYDEPVSVRGFDPSKFRAANKGQDAKREIFQTADASFFPTKRKEFQTPRYLQTTGQNLDDIDVDRRRSSPSRQLPSYNQSEIDLMAQLENEIL